MPNNHPCNSCLCFLGMPWRVTAPLSLQMPHGHRALPQPVLVSPCISLYFPVFPCTHSPFHIFRAGAAALSALLSEPCAGVLVSVTSGWVSAAVLAVQSPPFTNLCRNYNQPFQSSVLQLLTAQCWALHPKPILHCPPIVQVQGSVTERLGPPRPFLHCVIIPANPKSG